MKQQSTKAEFNPEAHRLLQIELNSNKLVLPDFKKSPEEKAELVKLKKLWKQSLSK